MVNIGKWTTSAWELFAKQWFEWMLLMVVFYLMASIPMILGLIGLLVLVAMNMSTGDIQALEKALSSAAAQQDANPQAFLDQILQGAPLDETQRFILIVILVFLFTLMISSLIMPPLTAGVFKAAFNQMRTGELHVSDIFLGFEVFWPSVIGTGMVGLFVAIGLMFCIVPGLFVMIVSMLMLPLIAEKRMGFLEAFRESRRIVQKDFWSFSFYFLLAVLIMTFGSSLCALIVLVTAPLFYLMIAVAVRETIGVDGAAAIAEQEQAAAARPFGPVSDPPPPADQHQGFAPPRQPYPPAQQDYQAPPQGSVPPPPPPPQKRMFCAGCGAPVRVPGARFCETCGKPL